MTKRILVTGASGFVGSKLFTLLATQPAFQVLGAVRKKQKNAPFSFISVGEINGNTDWSDAVRDQSVIVHAAARAHIMKDGIAEPLTEYRKVNVEGTLNLARHASEAGVKRIVFISSIKVNGEQTQKGQPFTEEDESSPEDAYSLSKLEAEQGLQSLAKQTGMEIVIIRPPLVYGPGVKGNFANMIKFVEKGLPLPLGAIHNKRSFVALDNLVDLIITCIEHPAAANQLFLAGDGEDVSTSELLRALAKAMGKPSRLIPVPNSWIMFGATLLGKRPIAQRLLGSLQVDIFKSRELLGWQPVVTMEEQLAKMFSDVEVARFPPARE